MIIGNLGRDPEVRVTQGGGKVATLNAATTESWKDKSGEKQENTEWHRLVVFGKGAEIVEKYLHKGSKVFFEGKLQTRKWTDKNNQERYTTEIIVDNFKMLDSKNNGQHTSDDEVYETNQTPKPATQQVPFDDDIPF